MASQQAVTLDAVGTDCKSKRTIQVKLTSQNKDDYTYRFVLDKGKLVCLDDETIGNYVGKTVQMRSVKYCIAPEGKICYACAGKLFYLLNIRNSGLTSSRVSSTLLNLSMKKFHDASIKLYQINPSDMMLSTALKPVKESIDSDKSLDKFVEEMIEDCSVEEEIVMEAIIPAKSSNGGFYHCSPTQNLTKLNASTVQAYPSIGSVVFASQSKGFAACFGGEWSEDHAVIDIIHSNKDSDEYKVNEIKQIVFTYNPQFVDVEVPCSLYQVAGRFFYLSYDGDLEVVSKQDTRVVREIKYSSWKEAMISNGVKVIELKG